VVDETVAAAKIAAIRDAVGRIRTTLPETASAFEEDRTAPEVVVLNLFVALQECVSLATHWLGDAGQKVPGSCREIFPALAESGVLSVELARRLAAAAGFRNLVAHQYGVVEPARVHAMATEELDDRLEFCNGVSRGISGR
jgi:uncharacterized protein YutE (UPF0331/DUF86 family)